MLSSSTSEIMLTASKAMFKIFLVVSAGILGSKAGILQQTSLSLIAKLSNNLLLPCLIVSSLGVAISVESLQRLSVMVLFSFIVNCVSYFSVKLIGRYIMGTSDKILLSALTVAASSPNCIALPLLVCSTLCEQNNVNLEYQSNSATCFTDAKAMIFVYAIGWHTLFWSFGMSRLSELQTMNNDDPEIFNYNPIVIFKTFNWLDTFKFFQVVFFTPTILATLLGISIGLLDSIKNGLFHDPTSLLSPIGGALVTLGEPVVCLNTLIMAGSLASVKIKLNYNDLGKLTGLFVRKRINVKDDYDIAENNSKSYEVINALHDSKLQDDTVINNNNDNNILINSNPGIRSITAFLCCRLLLPGIAIIPILKAFRDVGLIPKEKKLMFLVICIITSSPSAQMIVVCLNQLGLSELASKVSFLYLFQYSFSILTITLWSTIAMSIFY